VKEVVVMGGEPCCENAETHVRMHRSWRSVLPQLIIGLLIAILVLVISLRFGLFATQINLGEDTVTLPLFLLILIVLSIRPLLLMFDCRHELGCHHLRSAQGIVSLKKEQVEIPFEDILGVRFTQSILERILNVGTILVWTASAEKPEVSLKGIGDPAYFARIIKDRIDQAKIKRNQKAR